MELTRCNIGVQALRLVDDEPGCFRVLARKARYVLVGCRDTGTAIHHDQRHVSLLQRAHRLGHHDFLDALLSAGNAAGVDDEIGNRAELTEAVLAVARQPGIIGNNRVT